ncbi:MAG: type II toxin-antitoxin system VapC family toxin [Candidatus Magnetomorum sp.]|nr:type II toxin-antitoxin system VapC family toxin [Candidatus Magnetomorum sp.]
MNVYLDTSALIKLYHCENGSKELLAFLQQNADDLILTIADITRTEFHSAFLRRVRTKDISLEAINKIFEAFDHDLHMFNLIKVDDTVKQLSVILLDNIAHQKGLRTLDAYQLSAALFCNQFLQVDIFVSSDQKFLKVAKDFFSIFDPENSNF